jgi:hypothetical protein
LGQSKNIVKSKEKNRVKMIFEPFISEVSKKQKDILHKFNLEIKQKRDICTVVCLILDRFSW